MKILLFFVTVVCAVQANIVIQVIQEVKGGYGGNNGGGGGGGDETTEGELDLDALENELNALNEELNNLQNQADAAVAAADAIAEANSAIQAVLDALNSGGRKRRRHRRSVVDLEECDPNVSLDGEVGVVMVTILGAIEEELAGLADSLDPTKLNCYIALLNGISADVEAGTLDPPDDMAAVTNSANSAGSAAANAQTAVDEVADNIAASITAAEEQIAATQDAINEAGGSDEHGTGNHEWGYTGENGPSHWAEVFNLCGGSSQSPINIDTSSAVGDLPWEPLTFDNYDQTPTSITLTNNGHSAQIAMEINSDVGVEGGHVTGHYTFHVLHFHWGSENSQGSEHTIDGVRYPVELHLVHYKTEYGSIQNAIMESDGLAVLGIMFEISEEDNDNLTSVITGLQNIQSVGNYFSISPFPLQNLLPGNLLEFYQYQGSLTTPTCNEIVTWTVFKNPISISASQVMKFRELTHGSGHPMVNNYRPVQQLNDRTVYKGR